MMWKDKEANFERAIFFSWYCRLRDCAFCYMSTQRSDPSTTITGANKGVARRTTESILAEVMITKKLGWDLGFFSGGIGAYKESEFLDLLKKVHIVYGEKIWLNIGALTPEELELYAPYTKGVVGSIETVNEELHKKVCPSKPIEPYLKMFENAERIGLQRGITIILGLGETIEDYPSLARLVKNYGVSKVHFYSLNPQKGTIFENSASPSAEYQAEWIAKARSDFPNLDIQCGIWEDKVDRIGVLLKAGADSISKFPAIKMFGSKMAYEVMSQAKGAGYSMKSSLVDMPHVEWDNEVNSLPFDDNLKLKIKAKLDSYLKTMAKKKA